MEIGEKAIITIKVDITIQNSRIKERKMSKKGEEMTETTRETRTTKKKEINIVTLLKKKLIMNLKIMMKKKSMFL